MISYIWTKHDFRIRDSDQDNLFFEIEIHNYFFVVVKMKFKTIRRRNLQGRKVNSVYKAPRADKDALRKLRKPKLKLQSSDECCAQWIRRQPQKTRFLVMGNSEDSSMESLVPTFIIPWSRNKVRIILINVIINRVGHKCTADQKI